MSSGSVILHVIVVGFHHKRGCQVEYAYPPLQDDENVPDEWSHLPSLALPDGAHNAQSDLVYFLLPSRKEPGKSVYGISCYRQIRADELVARPDDVTRSTVQKSVCVLSRVPLFGVLKAKLQLITQAYFNERDFAKVEVLSQMHRNLVEMFEGDLVDGQAATMGLAEEGLSFAATPIIESPETSVEERIPGEKSEAVVADSTSETTSEEKTEVDTPENPNNGIIIEPAVSLPEDPLKECKDEYGQPLSIFTQSNLFHPYLSISYLDMLRSRSVRAYTIGATNQLFIQRRDLIDAIVTADENGLGTVELLDPDLKRQLTLTTADLRFGDYLIKNVEQNLLVEAAWEGGDEWLRMQFRSYLLSLGATVRSDLQNAVVDFGVPFVAAWKSTHNYRYWMGADSELASVPPGHAFAGQIGVRDLGIMVEHAVSGSDGAKRAMNALSTTGKNIGETGSRVKQSFTTWFKGAASAIGQAAGHLQNTLNQSTLAGTTSTEEQQKASPVEEIGKEETSSSRETRSNARNDVIEIGKEAV